MQKWEYQIMLLEWDYHGKSGWLDDNDNTITDRQKLASLGEDGWELVSVFKLESERHIRGI